MNNGWLTRSIDLYGFDKVDALTRSSVLVVGLGGVGSYAAELIARAGVGKMTIVDGDVVSESNRNRQIPALVSTQGLPKAEVMASRLKDINPELELTVVNRFVEGESLRELAMQKYDHVVDAIDSVRPKLDLIKYSVIQGNPIISSMGAAGKTDPSLIRLSDISKTSYCPLAAAVRKGLRAEGITSGVEVVYSVEMPENADGKHIPGTASYIPPMFGCYCAYAVIRTLTNKA